MSYTVFFDMHSGGSSKTEYASIYIAASIGEARDIFESQFGDPDSVSCPCCGPDYAVWETSEISLRDCPILLIDATGRKTVFDRRGES